LEAGAGVVADAFQHLATSVERLIAEREEHRVLANANSFLHALGHGIVGWLWLDQAIVCDKAIEAGAGPRDASFYSGKLRACDYFADTELARVPLWVAQVNAMRDVAASMPIEEF
jgi:butyryl-CoA dehydrogenase